MKLKKSTFLEKHEIKCLLKNIEEIGEHLNEDDIQIPKQGEYLMNIFQTGDLEKVIMLSNSYDLLYGCETVDKVTYVRLSQKQINNINELINSDSNEFKGRSRSYVIREAVNKFFE
jgi:hypothetical protein